jgi:hypothetical protein
MTFAEIVYVATVVVLAAYILAFMWDEWVFRPKGEK